MRLIGLQPDNAEQIEREQNFISAPIAISQETN